MKIRIEITAKKEEGPRADEIEVGNALCDFIDGETIEVETDSSDDVSLYTVTDAQVVQT